MPRGIHAIDTSCDLGTSTLETYYLNFIGRQLDAQKCLKNRKSQYWPTGPDKQSNHTIITNRQTMLQTQYYIRLLFINTRDVFWDNKSQERSRHVTVVLGRSTILIPSYLDHRLVYTVQWSVMFSVCVLSLNKPADRALR